ncbi:MAG: hypothetical protein QNJ13_03355 [Paracoccaceae bacterium]|nr:hypothetical protein [Paracoccaceae bacterium]
MHLRWVLSCTTGEALGVALVAVAFAAGDRGLVSAAPAVLTAGVWQGLALGTAQGLFLRRFGVSLPGWIAATVSAAVLGYALALLGGAGEGNGVPDHGGAPLAVVLGSAMLLGAVLGGVTGFAQALVARRHIVLGAWVLRNVYGWAIAMAAIFGGSALASADMSLPAIALLGAVTGALAGAAVGLVTAHALPEPD